MKENEIGKREGWWEWSGRRRERVKSVEVGGGMREER